MSDAVILWVSEVEREGNKHVAGVVLFGTEAGEKHYLLLLLFCGF